MIWVVVVAAAILGGVWLELLELRWRKKQEKRDREELRAAARRQ